MLNVIHFYPLRLHLVHAQGSKIQIKVFFPPSSKRCLQFETQKQKVPWDEAAGNRLDDRSYSNEREKL
ncbi:MAG: hypothetical protein CBD74_05195 [Saprospirales bacterium TMED214]|nr:MAG: hypothetical protein CBD74_05195 [Saprospirales bacterium TMED214]